jgi:hypothetical protein
MQVTAFKIPGNYTTILLPAGMEFHNYEITSHKYVIQFRFYPRCRQTIGDKVNHQEK